MLDTFNTIVPSTAQFFEFNCGIESNVNRRTQVWNKPRGVSMLRFLLIGAGGGGASGNNCGGGGGGAVVSWLVPAMFVPDRLIIAPGLGGAGGTGVNNGSDGVATSVGITPSLIILQAGAGSGGAGTGGGGGVGGIPSSLTYAGITLTSNGQTGSAANTAVAASTTAILGGGAGGSNTTAGTGASVTPQYNYPIINGGTSSGGNADNGFFMTQPILFGAGGAGGGGNAAGTGGRGGNGGIGCGGGGGGRGSATNGVGGNGGNGAVYIWAW